MALFTLGGGLASHKPFSQSILSSFDLCVCVCVDVEEGREGGMKGGKEGKGEIEGGWEWGRLKMTPILRMCVCVCLFVDLMLNASKAGPGAF